MALGNVVSHLPPVLPKLAAGVPDGLGIARLDGVAKALPVAPQLAGILPDLAVVLPDLASVLPDVARVATNVLAVAANVAEIVADLLGACHRCPQRDAREDAGHHRHARRPA